MLVVTALGGSVFLRRGEPLTAEKLRANVRIAAKALAEVASEHQLVISYGSGPQNGLLSMQVAASAKAETYPADMLGAQTEGMIGYMMEHELQNLLPRARAVATVLTAVEVDPGDPAFRHPTRFIGPVYLRDEAERLAHAKGWSFKPDGDKWRRVVASPEPKRICELRPITWLLERHTIVIAAGGGGIPTLCEGADRRLKDAECLVDTDLVVEVLARELEADVFVMLTDADAVYLDFGTPAQRAMRRVAPDALALLRFPPGSMGPKVDAACRFARATGKRAAIGAARDLPRILDGEAGTAVSLSEPELVCDDIDAPITNTTSRR